MDKVVYHKTVYSSGKVFEYWKTYDSRGNETSCKNSNGFVSVRRFDDRNNCIYYSSSEPIPDGTRFYEDTSTYDIKNKLLSRKGTERIEKSNNYED
jgi:hypothetical protein